MEREDFEKQAKQNIKQRKRQNRKNYFKKDFWRGLLGITIMLGLVGAFLAPTIVATVYGWKNMVANIIAWCWIGIFFVVGIVYMIVDFAQSILYNKRAELEHEKSRLYYEHLQEEERKKLK